jgi:hypothetical protein
MPEVQKTPAPAGETAARFVEFVLMHSQHILHALGLLAAPGQSPPAPNLEIARLLIDQLDAVRERTHGNLSSEEAEVLRNALQRVQLAYVEVAKDTSPPPAPPAPSTPPEPPPADPDDGKRFTKSYG